MNAPIKKITLEPRMFALLVKSQAGSILHLGAHFTLEEAYSAASSKIKTLATYKEGDMVDIDLWNSIPARETMRMLMDPEKVEEMINAESSGILSDNELADLPPMLQELLKHAVPITAKELVHKLSERSTPPESTKPVITDYIQHAKDAKNDLMKKLIEDGNIEAVEKVKGLLGTTSRKYVLGEIQKKNAEPNNK